mgnify:CR=1 FL=1
MAGRILIVDDDPDVLRLVERQLARAGMEPVLAADGAEARAAFQAGDLSAIVLDLDLPDTTGKELLTEFQAAAPDLPVLVLTASESLEDAVECMRLGAVDFIVKPFDRTRLVTSVRNADIQGRLRARVNTLSRELHGAGLAAMLGESPSIRRALSLLERAAGNEVTVLLLGESGTGKEVAARAVHAESSRRTEQFVAINCGAIPEGLIESELFGHEAGAFTGAKGSRAGRFEEANGGTLFLDEVGEMPLLLQVKLLRALQERAVQRVGGGKSRPVDVRVIAATNRDLKQEVSERRFREDLYYRLAVFPVELPPLRDREGDVLLLAERFLDRFADRHSQPRRPLADNAARALNAYGWPGNVRELENVLERAVILEDGDQITLGSLADEVVCAPHAEDPAPGRAPAPIADEGDEIHSFADEEKRLVLRALQITDWNVAEAARRLEIGRATIYRKIERYGLQQA